MQKNNFFKALIFVLAAVIVIQFISICALFFKNVKLKEALSKKAKRAFVSAPGKARPAVRAAIVLDDWGYNKKNLAAAFDLGAPVTFSVLPNLRFSREIASAAKNRGIEVILHLPLEAYDLKKTPEKGAIYTYMSAKEALTRLESAFDSVPGARGVSNHMGSKATEDERLMRILFSRFKTKDVYFLDSLVTGNSVCRRLAASMGVRFAARAVFLDNTNDTEYIKGQMRQLLALAKKRKSAVGIGHDRPLTIKTIALMLPEFQREGVELVYASELVK